MNVLRDKWDDVCLMRGIVLSAGGWVSKREKKQINILENIGAINLIFLL